MIVNKFKRKTWTYLFPTLASSSSKIVYLCEGKHSKSIHRTSETTRTVYSPWRVWCFSIIMMDSCQHERPTSRSRWWLLVLARVHQSYQQVVKEYTSYETGAAWLQYGAASWFPRAANSSRKWPPSPTFVRIWNLYLNLQSMVFEWESV